jgi:hypothetical protein
VIPPTSIFVGETITNNGLTQTYTNGTVRTISDPNAFSSEDPITQAIGYSFIDTYTNGSQTVFYTNGSVGYFTTQGFDHWIT